MLDGKGISEYALSRAGSFSDLTSWFKNATVYGTNQIIIDKINANTIQKIAGKQYKAPLMLNCYGLWYDSSYYSKLGIKVHDNFSQMLSNAATLKANGTSALIYPGMYSNYLVWGTIMPAVASYGQEFFNEVAGGENPSVYNDKRITAILTNLKTLADAKYVSASATQDHLGAQSDWLNHRAGLVSSGIWMETEMKNSIPGNFEMKFTTAGLNMVGQKPGVPLMSVGVCVSSSSENEKNAKDFLRFLYTDENLEKLAVDYGYCTVSKNQVPINKYSKTSQEIMKYIYSNSVVRVYKQNDWGNVGETFSNVANQVAQGTMTVSEAQKQLYKAAESN